MKKYLAVVAIFFVIIMGGCGHDHDHNGCDHGHGKKHAAGGHDHAHDETLQLAAYCCHLELFAQAAPFVAGQSGDILAHFSHLENIKPLAEGSVTISLIMETGSISQTLNKPTRTGVYHFKLNPPAAGSAKIIFDIETPAGKSQIIIPDITVYADEHEAHEAAAAAAVTSINGVIFNKKQQWKVDFATAQVSRRPFGQIIRTTAQIQPAQNDERIVAAGTGGAVFFDTIVTEGKAVRAGQTLFTIDGGTMADNNLAVRYVEAESEYRRAKDEYERKTELAKDNIISQSDLLTAQTEFANAEAAYNNLRRNFTAGKQRISSPISGYVTQISVQMGQYVEAGQPVLVVSQNRSLFLKAELRPQYFSLLNNVTSANIRLPNDNRTYSLEELGGRLLSYGRSLDVNNPLIPVVFQINNREEFLAGSFVDLFIKTKTAGQVITVPNEAIVEEMGNHFIFVQLTPELFEKRAVKAGVTDGFHTEIKEGSVVPGERIVSKGAIFVKLAQVSGALDPHAGHAH